MNVMRIRIGAIVEWLAAAACIVAMLSAGSFVSRAFGTVRAVMPVIAREAPAQAAPLMAAPAAIPPGAVSLPLLLLVNGPSLRIGQTFSAVTTRLAQAVEAQPPAVERAPNGERMTRFYEHRGTRFQLVFEPFEKDAEPRLAAIYR